MLDLNNPFNAKKVANNDDQKDITVPAKSFNPFDVDKSLTSSPTGSVPPTDATSLAADSLSVEPKKPRYSTATLPMNVAADSGPESGMFNDDLKAGFNIMPPATIDAENLNALAGPMPSVFNPPEPAPLTPFELEKQRLADLFAQPGPLQEKVDANLNRGYSKMVGVPGNYQLRLPVGVSSISDDDATTILAQANTYESPNNALMRGWGRLIGVTNVISKTLGIQNTQSFIENMQEIDRLFPDAPPEVGESIRAISEAEGVYGVTKAILDNPGAVLSVVGESLPTSMPTVFTALLGPFAPAGTFGTSFATEFSVVIDEEIKMTGVDLQDDEAMLELLSDEAFWAKARKRAKTRAGPIAIFDALSMGIAGKLLGKVIARGGSRVAVGGALGSEVLTQGALGGAGEAAAQRFEMYRGMKDKFSLGDVALETVGEFVPGAGEVAIKAKPSIDAAQQNQFTNAFNEAEAKAQEEAATRVAIDLLNPNSQAFQPEGELTATRADVAAEASRLADRAEATGDVGSNFAKGIRARLNNQPNDKELTDQDLEFYRTKISELEATPSEIAEQTNTLQKYFETKKGPSNTQAKYEKVINDGSYAPVIQQAEARLNELANQLRELGFNSKKLPTVLPPDADAIRSEMSGLAGITVRLINRHAAALAGNKKSKGKTTFAQDADETAMKLASRLGNGSLTNSGANVTGLDQPQAVPVEAAPIDPPQVAPVETPTAPPVLPVQAIPDAPQVETTPAKLEQESGNDTTTPTKRFDVAFGNSVGGLNITGETPDSSGGGRTTSLEAIEIRNKPAFGQDGTEYTNIYDNKLPFGEPVFVNIPPKSEIRQAAVAVASRVKGQKGSNRDNFTVVAVVLPPNASDVEVEAATNEAFAQWETAYGGVTASEDVNLKAAPTVSAPTAPAPTSIEQPAAPVVEEKAPDINPQEAEPVAKELPNKPVTSVQSPDGQANFNVQGRVIELADLKQATGDLQPRDRSRKESDALAKERAGSMFNPDRLLDDPTSGSGAPIIARDGTVMSGNGRVLTMQEVYTSQPESLSRYRSALEGAGISTEGFSQPVFVRQLTDDMTVQELKRFADLSNTEAQAQMSMTERASRDSTRLTDSGIIDLYRGDFDIDAAQNRGFVNEYAKKILSPTEQGAFVNSKGEISQEGISRVKNAILASAFDNPDTLATMLESSDENIKAISSAFMATAPKFAQLKKQIAEGRTDAQFDITSDLAEMANLVSRLRRDGVKLNDYYNQSDMLSAPDPEVQALVRAFYNQDLTRANSTKAMKDFLTFYADEALQKETGGLIPDDTSASDIIKAGRQRTEEKRDGGKRQAGLELAASSNVERNDAGSKQVQKRRNAESIERTKAVKPKAERKVDAATRPAPEQANKQENIRPADTNAVFDPKKVELREDTVRGVKSGRVLLKEVETLRQSLYDQAFTDAGVDPRKARNSSPKDQFSILQKLVTEKFDFSYVEKSDANNYNAVQALLDAYRNLQWMTHIMALPNTAIGLDGSLGLALPQVAWGGYLAAYFNKRAGMASTQSDIGSVQAPVVIMPGRSNSFAHEWGHALDYHLVDKLGEDWGRGVTGRIRTNLESGERPWQDGAPKSLQDAMGDLINAMFFDKAETAAKLMQLEQQIVKTEAYEAKTGKTTKKLETLNKQREKLIEGSTRAKIKSSGFKKDAKSYAERSKTDANYWLRPTEMFARAFEAYVAHNVETAGGTTEFITSSDQAYKLTLEQVKGADDRLALTYPNDPDRHNIYLAMDRLMDAIRTDFIQGNPAKAPGDYDMIDAHQEFAEAITPDMPKGGLGSRTVASLKQTYKAAVADQIRAHRAGKALKRKEAARPSAYPEGTDFWTKAGMRFNDNIGFAYIQSKRGNLLTLINRYRIFKNKKAQDVLETIFERIATDPGSLDKRTTVEGGTFEEAVSQVGRRYTHKLLDIMNKHELEALSEGSMKKLRLLLTSDQETISGEMPDRLLNAAYEIRTKILNPIYDYMQKSGVNVNYLSDSAYMPRMMDTVLALANETEFRYGKGGSKRGAVNLYSDVVFESELGVFEEGNLDQVGQLVSLSGRLQKSAVLNGMVARKRYSTGQIQRLSELTKTAKNARGEVNRLNKEIERLDAEGEDVGALMAKVEEATETLNEVHEELYDALRQPYGELMTENWIVRMKSSLGGDPEANSVQGSFSKARKLPKEADSYLVDYYLDPLEALTQYIPSVVRRAEYQKRFGEQLVPKNYKQNKGANVIPGFPPPVKDYAQYLLEDAATEAGISPQDIDLLREIIQTVTGTKKASHGRVGKGLANLHAYGTMTLLPRAVYSSIAEPISVGIQTGNTLDGFKAFLYGFDEALTTIRGKKAVERKLYYRQMAKILGVIDDPASGELVANRLGGSVAEDPKAAKRLSYFFARTGLAGLTNAQRRASMRIGMQYMAGLADQYQNGKTKELKDKASEILADFGVRGDILDDFTVWLSAYEKTGTLPDIQTLIERGGELTDLGQIYAVAVGRFTDQSIQDPKIVDRPLYAETPVGRMVYQIQSFSASFTRNVLIMMSKRVTREYKERGFVSGATHMMINNALPLATLYMAHALVSASREALLNPDRWEEEKKNDTLLKYIVLDLGLTRSGVLGRTDTLYNAYTSMKYESDLTNILAGPSLSYYGKSFERILGIGSENSANTVSSEYQLARGVYDLLIPTLAAYMTSTPNTYGKIAGYGLGAASALVSSPAVKHWVLRNVINEIYDEEYYPGNPGRGSNSKNSRRSSNKRSSSSRSSRDR